MIATFCTCGGEGAQLDEAAKERIANALPDAELVVLQDCGHVTYAEQPEQFAAAVAGFATR